MIRQARIQLMTSRTSQPQRGTSLLLALPTSALEPCNSPSIPSPKLRSFAWQGAEDDADHRELWPTPSLLLQLEAWQPSRYSSTAVRVRRRSYRDALQTSVSIGRQFSRVFPVLPSVTRFGAYPAPGGTARLCFFGFQKTFSARTARAPKEKIFRTFRKSTPSALGSGAHSRRFAQECPEGNPGKYKQGETQWHSTKTKSL